MRFFLLFCVLKFIYLKWNMLSRQIKKLHAFYQVQYRVHTFKLVEKLNILEYAKRYE